MPIGNQPTNAPQFNMLSAQLAVRLRGVCQDILVMQDWVAKKGTSGLQDIGFNSTDANDMLYQVGYMNTIAQIYYGHLQQGGSGGSGAATFNFADALSDLTGPT